MKTDAMSKVDLDSEEDYSTEEDTEFKKRAKQDFNKGKRKVYEDDIETKKANKKRSTKKKKKKRAKTKDSEESAELKNSNATTEWQNFENYIPKPFSGISPTPTEDSVDETNPKLIKENPINSPIMFWKSTVPQGAELPEYPKELASIKEAIDSNRTIITKLINFKNEIINQTTEGNNSKLEVERANLINTLNEYDATWQQLLTENSPAISLENLKNALQLQKNMLETQFVDHQKQLTIIKVQSLISANQKLTQQVEKIIIQTQQEKNPAGQASIESEEDDNTAAKEYSTGL